MNPMNGPRSSNGMRTTEYPTWNWLQVDLAARRSFLADCGRTLRALETTKARPGKRTHQAAAEVILAYEKALSLWLQLSIEK